MKNKLRKSLLILLSILTLGLVSPSQFDQNVKADGLSKPDSFETAASESSLAAPKVEKEESDFDREKFINELIDKAEVQSYQKFGSRIKPVIQDEFREIILPKIETAISQTAAIFPEEDVRSLSITEQPGGGNSEKIFHIKNMATGKDILRFHVRRDNPPLDGFWFNFHYHTIFDGYETHHDLGSIYWSKDIPPKWMS
jgi:hypothetical protein